ncbi:hypothetical protein glysoja_021864 [Glycine soja]|nr:hypothetical protein glysoja_021864 [Glycine soja]
MTVCHSTPSPAEPQPLSLSPPGLARCHEETVTIHNEIANKLERDTEGARNLEFRHNGESRNPTTSTPFILGGALSIVAAVLIIGHSADIGWWFGDTLEHRPWAVGVFVFFLDFHLQIVNGSPKSCNCVPTVDHGISYLVEETPAFGVAAVAALASGLIAVLFIPRPGGQKPSLEAQYEVLCSFCIWH